MLNLKNTLDGYLKNVEVIGNTIQDENNLADIRSVGDKVEGQELYKIDVVSRGKNLIKKFELGGLVLANGDLYETNDRIRTDFIRVDSKALRASLADSSINLGIYVFEYDKNKSFIKQSSGSWFSLQEETKYIKIVVAQTTDINISVQIEEGTQVTPYEPYQEDKLEILSPVQLEKVGDVADRIICKDGVWGIEKNIGILTLSGQEVYNVYGGNANQETVAKYQVNNIDYDTLGISRLYIDSGKAISNKFTGYSYCWDSDKVNTFSFHPNLNNIYFNVDPSIDDITKFKKHIRGTVIKFPTLKPQFIPLPQDQQVKLRTFAGQTNIAFLTEIPGQIKAQVPKSLGATVNTHTEQIADLHNSLDRVKKLEETTVSTIETGSGFTTVDATSNGYFEGVKLEGKTLVNLPKTFGDNSTSGWLQIGSLVHDVTNKTITICNLSDKNIKFQTSKLDSSFGSQVIINPFSSVVVALNNTKFRMIQGAYSDGWTSSDLDIFKKSIVILEGDHTNNPPEYFEGLMSVGQDVEEVSVESISGNLFDGELIPNNIDLMATGSNNICSKNFIPVEEGQKYILSSELGYHFELFFYDDSFKGVHFMQLGGSWDFVKPVFVVPSGYKYLKFRTWSNENNTDVKICVSKFKDNPLYIPHQVNKKPLLYYNPTTETWEKPVLRKWDTIEKHSDGKYYYHKRSEEVVLNGSENWVGLNTSSELFNRMYISLPGKAYAIDNFVSDNFIFKSDIVTNISGGGFAWGNINNDTLWFTFSKTLDSKSKWIKHLQANPTTLVYQLAQEEVYECTNIDLMTYSGETNYIINSGAISPKSLLKVHNNISNVVKILQEKVSLLENTFIAGLKSVLSGDMYSLATILYPEDFEQNDNTEQDIMVIPE